MGSDFFDFPHADRRERRRRHAAVPLTAKLDKLTLAVDWSQLSDEGSNKLEAAQATAIDGTRIRHLQGAH